MKRKFITGAIIFAAAVLLTVGMLALFPGKLNDYELFRSTMNTDKPLELHFEGYQIKLISWESDEVKISESQSHRDLCKENIDFTSGANILTVASEGKSLSDAEELVNSSLFCSQTWLSLIQFEKYFDYSKQVWDYAYTDFYIYVPKQTQVSAYCNGVINLPEDIDLTLHWPDVE